MSDVIIATNLISACEHDLGRVLSAGEMRDLVMDNTDWRSDRVRQAVKDFHDATGRAL